MEKMKVLIVDDVEIFRTSLKTFLYFLHFEADLAVDGLNGLDYLSKNKYDIIFTDLEMPNMNGLEFLVKIKSNSNTKNIPVVMLTSVEDDTMIEKAKKLGASGYLIKPFNKDKILPELEKLGLVKK